ncbi:MAG: GNAT family N-acetyltransferase [Synechococcales cyanobacterium C42_A2020_086]|jgi:mycothiol synthase|nr:GNAT family N-acetyltransferase [Synechococcales cyanobacterium C42_A2020_086]
MTVLTVRPYASEVDLPRIADFLNACEAVDREDSYYSVIDLQTGFAEPGFDPTQNVRLWEDAAGELIAYAELWIPVEFTDTADGLCWFRVRPDARHQGLETNILTWAETRVLQVAAQTGLPPRLAVGCRDDQTDRIALYERHGFVYERCFLKMERSLAEPIPEPQLPQGFRVVPLGGVEHAAAWVEMCNQTFIDHWNFRPYTVEEHRYWLTTPKYCPELDLVAVAPDGTFAAFCVAHIDAEENQHLNRQDGWISTLGTRRGFRRQGLARAMLLTGLQRLQAAGMDTALLGVDTENPNNAQTLYESVGFRKRHANLSYAKRQFEGQAV